MNTESRQKKNRRPKKRATSKADERGIIDHNCGSTFTRLAANVPSPISFNRPQDLKGWHRNRVTLVDNLSISFWSFVNPLLSHGQNDPRDRMQIDVMALVPKGLLVSYGCMSGCAWKGVCGNDVNPRHHPTETLERDVDGWGGCSLERNEKRTGRDNSLQPKGGD